MFKILFAFKCSSGGVSFLMSLSKSGKKIPHWRQNVSGFWLGVPHLGQNIFPLCCWLFSGSSSELITVLSGKMFNCAGRPKHLTSYFLPYDSVWIRNQPSAETKILLAS